MSQIQNFHELKTQDPLQEELSDEELQAICGGNVTDGAQEGAVGGAIIGASVGVIAGGVRATRSGGALGLIPVGSVIGAAAGAAAGSAVSASAGAIGGAILKKDH